MRTSFLKWFAIAPILAALLATLSPSALGGTLLISEGSPVRILVPTNDPGSGWRAVAFADQDWLAGTNGVGFEASAIEYGAVVIADSETDWSTSGQQGERGWINGFYDKTADPAGTYGAEKFQPFCRSEEPWGPKNFWDGSAWNWAPGDPPWDWIARAGIHPNGTNNLGVEHWAIRRWCSSVSGPVTLQFHLRKDNPNGNGVTGKVFRNGVELFSRAIAGSDMAGFNETIAVTVEAGDFLDFAITPVGADGDGNDGADGSVMRARVLAGALVEPPATTDTLTGWGSGAQGESNWFYGFWNKSADPDGLYNPDTDFNNTDPNWTLGGGFWLLGPGDPPWSIVGQNTWHPNGPSPVHWVVKRWLAPAGGDFNCRVQFAKGDPSCGNGTTLHVFHNGVERGTFTVAFNDTQGIDSFVLLPAVQAGDKIDFALDPTGTDGQPIDWCDGSRLAATIYPGLTPWKPSLRPLFATDLAAPMRGVSSSVYLRFPFTVPDPTGFETLRLNFNWNDGCVIYLNGQLVDKRNAPTVIEGSTIADSVTNWSATGEQGAGGWYGGYYDRSLDVNGMYEPADFTLFPSGTWNGSGWDLNASGAPWTELYQENCHPNASNGGTVDPGNPGTHEHWVGRRWIATVDSPTLKCRFKFRKNNPNCGDGIIGYIFHRGQLVYSNSIPFDDAVGKDEIVDLPEVLGGDELDFFIAPGSFDYCDGSAFSVTIFEGAPAIPWNAAATGRRTFTGPSSVPTVLDLTSFLPVLNAGSNVLAVQALNFAADDADFLFRAELEANRKPVPQGDALMALPGTTTEIPAALLFANDSDPDDDSLLLVGTTPGGYTPAGGQAQLMGQTIHYTPPEGFNGTDHLTYTVTDISGVPVQATVDLTVAGQRIESIGLTSEGTPLVIIPGTPGVNYTLERATELPASTWTLVDGPKPVGPDGKVRLVDSTPPAAQAFYRVVLQR